MLWNINRAILGPDELSHPVAVHRLRLGPAREPQEVLVAEYGSPEALDRHGGQLDRLRDLAEAALVGAADLGVAEVVAGTCEQQRGQCEQDEHPHVEPRVALKEVQRRNREPVDRHMGDDLPLPAERRSYRGVHRGKRE